MRRIVMAAALIAAGGFGAACAAGPKYELYVLAFVGGKEAEAHCPGAKMNMTRVALLRAATVRDADERGVEAELLRAKANVEGQIAKLGETRWCVTIDDLFGEHGDMLAGVIDFN